VKDPLRIREAGSDAPPELRDLFRDAQKPEPLPPVVDARVTGQVAALGSVPAAAPLKAPPWFVAGGAVVVAGALALVGTQRGAEPQVSSRAPSTPSAAPLVAAAPIPPAVAAAPAPDQEKRASQASAARATPAESASASQDALAGEAKLLNQAHAAMATDPQKALAIAGEHAKRYPRGQLAAERELILVQALVKLGRVREAEARGRALRKSTPSSIYGERLDTILKGK
jgi:TolA-binding protein